MCYNFRNKEINNIYIDKNLVISIILKKTFVEKSNKQISST